MNPTETLTAAPTWDLDTIFSGETESKEYAKFRADVRDDLKKYEDEIKSLPGKLDNSNLAKWSEFINRLQALTGRIYDAESFAHCLISRDVKDEKAGQIVGEIDVYNAALKRIMVLLEAFAKEQEDSMWQKLVNSGELKEGSYFLDELRRMAKIKMAPEYETLAAELAVNGYHAWNRLYDKIYGELSAEFKENGNVSNLSLGQLANKMSNPNRDIRRQSFEKLEAAWESRGGEATMILNYMAGFRLSLYKKRKWDSILTEPLFESRIKNETLDAMWDAVNKSAPQMKRYIAAKKKLLGIDNFRWYDQTAPVGASDKQYSFVEACDFIIDKLGAFNKKQGEFTQMAINNRWVEAENRPGKAGGAFCTSFIGKKQSRVLMTYESSFDNLLTLAHELGHAYHQQLLKDEPVFAMS
jgi:oligoendopeptidase F